MAYNYYNPNPYYQPNYFGNNGATPDMLNQMKTQYQPIAQPIQQTPTNQNANNDIIWVQGEAGAKAYLVAPNNTVTLWDSESSTIYVKSADINGVPSMRVLDFTERNAPKMPSQSIDNDTNKYILKKELNAVEGKIEDITNRLSDIESKISKTATKTTKKSEE